MSELREIATAKQRLPQTIEKRGIPQKLTLAGSAASPQAVGELQQEGILPVDLPVRTTKYVNNLIEQDSRRVKQRVRPMLGFKRFAYAVIPLAGIELVPRIKKRQFDVWALCPAPPRTPPAWEAGLTP